MNDTKYGSDLSAVCIKSRQSMKLCGFQTFGVFSVLAKATNLVHFVHVRWISVELYKDRNLLASAPPSHDTLGSERRGAGDAGEGHLLSAEVAVEHLATADRRRPMHGGVRRRWSPVVVVARCSWSCNAIWRQTIDILCFIRVSEWVNRVPFDSGHFGRVIPGNQLR